MIFILWILFSFIVGGFGHYRTIGATKAYFISLFLSPLVGLIFVLMSNKLEDENYRKAIYELEKESLSELKKQNKTTAEKLGEELERIAKLRDSGKITPEEYNQLRLKLFE